MARALLYRWICTALIWISLAEVVDQTLTSCSKAVSGASLIQHLKQIPELKRDQNASLAAEPLREAFTLSGSAVAEQAQVWETSASKASVSTGFALFGASTERTLAAWPKKLVLTGAMCGCIGGALGGLAAVVANQVVDRNGPHVTIAGVLIGGLMGGTLAYVGHLGVFPIVIPLNVPQDVTDRVFDEPVMDKLEHFALQAATVAGYEEATSKTFEELKAYQEDKEAALKIKNHLFEMERSPNQNKSAIVDDFIELEEIMSHGHTSEFESAQTAYKNQALFTEHDIAMIENGVRGEDNGPANTSEKVAARADMLFASSVNELIQHTGQAERVAAGVPWKDATVNYCIAPDVGEHLRHIISATFLVFARAIPCLKFNDVGVKRGNSQSSMEDQLCNKSPAIFIASNPYEGCYAYVGMIQQFRSQRVQLQDPSCASLGIVKHEIGHALGMAHEQSRSDRDKYVRVYWHNIRKGKEANFDIVDNGYVQQDYDLLSIMHYDSYAFAVDQTQVTIEQQGAVTHDAMGQRNALSEHDVNQIAHMYEYEDETCVATAVDGQGCIDNPDSNGNDMCSTLTACTAQAVSLCCACGGGTQVQCYKGSPCPQVPKLPPPAGSFCIEDITFHYPGSGYPCIYQNKCDFDVKFKCPSQPCEHLAKSKKATLTYCGSVVQTEICEPGKCTVWEA